MNVLFVNHSQENCGVYQYGLRVANIVRQTQKHLVDYFEINSAEEFAALVNARDYQVVIYNWYVSTMGWLTEELSDFYRGHFVQCSLHHGLLTDRFDYRIYGDPTYKEKGNFISVPVPLLTYESQEYPINDIPTFGSFGFGMAGKGYPRVVNVVEESYDEALIRLHIPAAHFGDEDGTGARQWARMAEMQLTKPGIKLEVTHDFLSNQEMLHWLALNDANVFLYERNPHDGVSSVVDYALSVRRPIALSDSEMFRHLWDADISVTNHTLREIVDRGLAPLRPYYDKYSQANLVRRYEEILERIT